jgi:superfamily II DNA/RNA helicase
LSTPPIPDRSELAGRYLDQLPFTPYPIQEEALLAWFTAEQGVMVCAPTGMGKTLIAQAALYEALHTNTVSYYTTPLIALTEQKFHEMQTAAVRWGFRADDVGLVTGNRSVNPDANVLVVVAEILLNRLLHQSPPAATGGHFDFANVSSVVMDEFHSFADPERGIVWELTLSLLPKHIRLLLLSATVGNATEFVNWLDHSHGRKVELVEGTDRTVPLVYHWVPDELLNELIVDMAKGDAATRKTPALVFCFNRDECWSVAEQLKGLDLLPGADKKPLHDALNDIDWGGGVGPKLKQILHRGVGVHHAGLLPRYKRVVERLFEKKLLSVCVCTETLAAGINLPARSVVVSSLVKGPYGKEKPIDPSSAHQMFGRAGRPQFDSEGHVYAIAPEDDVKILRWKEKYDQIPENTKDPVMLKKKKELKRKKPSRREGVQYWNEGTFDRLKAASPGKLYSKGPLPWRLLAYMLKLSPEVDRIRAVIRKRLLDEARIIAGVKHLETMLTTLHEAGYVVLDPVPESPKDTQSPPVTTGGLSKTATPTPRLDNLLAFRSIHPLYGSFLIDQLGTASDVERLQAFESVLELPKPLLKFVRVPLPDQLPPGPLEIERLDPELLRRGLIAAPKPPPAEGEEEEDDDEPFERPPSLAEKLFLYYEALVPGAVDLHVHPVWAANELLHDYAGDFNNFIRSRDLTKQEGLIFRHFLRLVLLCGEFQKLTPTEGDPEAWQTFLRETMNRLTESCRAVDPQSTDEIIQAAKEADVVENA